MSRPAITALIASTAGFACPVVTAHGGLDRQGRPLGTDFSNVYAAGTNVLEGKPDVPFDPPREYGREPCGTRTCAIAGL